MTNDPLEFSWSWGQENVDFQWSFSNIGSQGLEDWHNTVSVQTESHSDHVIQVCELTQHLPHAHWIDKIKEYVHTKV